MDDKQVKQAEGSVPSKKTFGEKAKDAAVENREVLVGAAVGTAIVPGVGTAVGAGLGWLYKKARRG